MREIICNDAPDHIQWIVVFRINSRGLPRMTAGPFMCLHDAHVWCKRNPR